MLRAHAIHGFQTATTDKESIAAIATTPGAFGTTTLAMLACRPRHVTVLSLDRVAPTLKTLTDGPYKVQKTFCLVFLAPAAPEVARFRDYVHSERGRAILLQPGQVPVQSCAITTTSR